MRLPPAPPALLTPRTLRSRLVHAIWTSLGHHGSSFVLWQDGSCCIRLIAVSHHHTSLCYFVLCCRVFAVVYCCCIKPTLYTPCVPLPEQFEHTKQPGYQNIPALPITQRRATSATTRRWSLVIIPSSVELPCTYTFFASLFPPTTPSISPQARSKHKVQHVPPAIAPPKHKINARFVLLSILEPRERRPLPTNVQARRRHS
jgi:hypothetical protein